MIESHQNIARYLVKLVILVVCGESDYTSGTAWMGFNCFKATEALRGDSLLFITRFPGVHGTHLIDIKRMKG